MHKIVTSIRQIAPADLPTVTPIGEATRPMNEQELLNAGIQRLTGDYYSCIHQEERDDDTLQWSPKEGQSLPGTVVTEGFLEQRHDKLPADVRAKVMKASVIRSTLGNADDLVSAVLLDAASAAEKAVGMIEGAPLIDVADPEMLLGEAQRQLSIPDSGFTRETVAMADMAAGDVIEAENLIPHSWAGEPKR
jgi:hypothetical protein